jgi:hypothetical protein
MVGKNQNSAHLFHHDRQKNYAAAIFDEQVMWNLVSSLNFIIFKMIKS